MPIHPPNSEIEHNVKSKRLLQRTNTYTGETMQNNYCVFVQREHGKINSAKHLFFFLSINMVVQLVNSSVQMSENDHDL